MLVSLLNLVFSILIFAVQVASWLLLAYVLMSLIAPLNKYTVLIGKYAEPVLTPIRGWLQKVFPKLGQMRLDLSPIVAWVLIEIVIWLLTLLKNILL